MGALVDRHPQQHGRSSSFVTLASWGLRRNIADPAVLGDRAAALQTYLDLREGRAAAP